MANRETSVNEGWKLVSIGLCVFSGNFGVRSIVLCKCSGNVLIGFNIFIETGPFQPKWSASVIIVTGMKRPFVNNLKINIC